MRHRHIVYPLALILGSLLLTAALVNVPPKRPLPTDYQIEVAMDEHREVHPTCYVCGASKSLYGQATYCKFIEGYSRPKFKGKKIRAGDWLEMHGLYIEVKNLPVHPIKSQKPFPQFADDKGNLITLCWSCHFWLGHLKGKYKTHNANLLETVEAIRAAYTNTVVDYNKTLATSEDKQ